VVVSPAQPSITTTQNPSAGHVGATLQDIASLTGYHPTGTITFFLNDPKGDNVYHETVNVTDGNRSYSTATGFAANVAGTWHWWAEYNGDANNNKASSGANDEPVVITEGEVQPSISTTPIPETAKVGDVLKDQATLVDTSDATGTITFTLYDPNGHNAYHETVTVSKYHTVYTTPNGFMAYGPGTWHWSAAYSGDANNNAVHSQMAAEPVVVSPAQPSITTSPAPTSAIVGATLKDTATLSGGYHPTGTITFTLYDPNSTSAYTETATVSGNGPYSTVQGFAANMAGTWHWSAAYSGDANNNAVHSQMADEPVTITATGGVLADTATGGVLAATGSTLLAEALALFLVGFGALAILVAAVAWRRPRVA
jgi:hypothetical protein